MKKRLLASLLTLIMIFGLMPTTALAANDSEFHVMNMEQIKELVSKDHDNANTENIRICSIYVHGVSNWSGKPATATGGVTELIRYTGLNWTNCQLLPKYNGWKVLNSSDIIRDDSVSAITIYAKIGKQEVETTAYIDKNEIDTVELTGWQGYITQIYLTKATLKPQHSVTYQVTGLPEGTTVQVPESTSYAEGSTVTLAAVPKVEGYTCDGWTTEDVEIRDGGFTMPSHDVSFTAVYQKKTTVEPEEGPSKQDVIDAFDKGQGDIKLACTTNSDHGKRYTELQEEAITSISAVQDGKVTVTVSVAPYVVAYNTETSSKHEAVGTTQKTFNLKKTDKGWELDTPHVSLEFSIKCTDSPDPEVEKPDSNAVIEAFQGRIVVQCTSGKGHADKEFDQLKEGSFDIGDVNENKVTVTVHAEEYIAEYVDGHSIDDDGVETFDMEYANGQWKMWNPDTSLTFKVKCADGPTSLTDEEIVTLLKDQVTVDCLSGVHENKQYDLIDGTYEIQYDAADPTVIEVEIEGTAYVNQYSQDTNTEHALMGSETQTARLKYENSQWTVTGVTFRTTCEETPVAPEKPMLDISKSKTADGLVKSGSSYTTNVTLSLPAESYKRNLDVVIVLDGSCSTEDTDSPQKAAVLLEELSRLNNINVKVGLVVFGGYTPVLKEFKLVALDQAYLNDLTTYLTPVNGEYQWRGIDGRKGSNLQAGVETAYAQLNGDGETASNDKYMIILSDAGTFSWYENNDVASKFYLSDPNNRGTEYYYWCNPADFQRSYQDANRASRTFDDVWTLARTESGKQLLDEHVLTLTQVNEYKWSSTTTTTNQKQYQGGYTADEISKVLEAVKKGECAAAATWQKVKDTASGPNTDYITTREAASYYAATSIMKAAKASNVIFVSYPYHENEERLFSFTESFKDWLETNAGVTLYHTGKYSADADEAEDIFADIKDEMVYLIGAGSEVVDVIGKDFDLAGVDTFKMTVDGQGLTGVVADDGVTVNFGTADAAGVYPPYVVVYDKEQDSFTWKINVPVKKAGGVQLTYTLKLVNQPTSVGTHKLPTNVSAVLKPVDTNQVPGQAQAFPVPEVTYTVSGTGSGSSGGGSSGGSSNKPSTGLNTDDHYSYIIGYQDGYLRPYGTITRGEVATIFFRLLTDDTREDYWSQSNPYSDCNSELWCNNAISTLTRMGIIDGFQDGTFRPYAKITRAQFAKIAVGFFETTREDYEGFFTDVDIDAWYTEYVEAAARVGLIQGFEDGTFRPNTNITRAQACVIVNRALGRKPDEDHLLSERKMITWPDNNPGDWFYADMQEATNSHDYTWLAKGSNKKYMEEWTKKLEQRDWAALEHAWSTAHSAPGGEVTK